MKMFKIMKVRSVIFLHDLFLEINLTWRDNKLIDW